MTCSELVGRFAYQPNWVFVPPRSKLLPLQQTAALVPSTVPFDVGVSVCVAMYNPTHPGEILADMKF
jgi:hypothetical protein